MHLRSVLLGLLTIALAACGTYYDPSDKYVVALRWFDRGDYKTARELWEPLAAKGDCDAEFRLGLLYFLAYGVDRDVPKAIALWTKAANAGQPRAQYALGDLALNREADTRLYCRTGCDGLALEDHQSALTWYLLADRDATYANDRKYLASVIPRSRAVLTDQQQRAAESTSDRWQPTPAACHPRSLL
jgi:TPR repeat protein